MKSITIFNFKGGQGKTSIALNLALSLDMNIITNDKYTWLDIVLPRKYFVVVPPGKDFPQLDDSYKIIYDLGGWLDSRTTDIIVKTDLIIIPMIDSYMNNTASLNTIDEVIKINKNIIVIANCAVKSNFDHLQEIINMVFPENNIKIFPLNKSTAFDKIIFYKKTIKEIAKEHKILAKPYSKIVGQFDNIIKYIKKEIKL